MLPGLGQCSHRLRCRARWLHPPQGGLSWRTFRRHGRPWQGEGGRLRSLIRRQGCRPRCRRGSRRRLFAMLPPPPKPGLSTGHAPARPRGRHGSSAGVASVDASDHCQAGERGVGGEVVYRYPSTSCTRGARSPDITMVRRAWVTRRGHLVHSSQGPAPEIAVSRHPCARSA